MKFGVHIPEGSTEHDVVFTLVKNILKAGDATVLALVWKRVGGLETTTVYDAEVLALDEAMESLDEADKRVCIEQQKHAPP